ncbi:hypothetical protein TgHK011_006523 [Trichoderma gracile]|nr:hypothetical protein TgHK011_006523 [Trichoderma gracile]
MYVGHTASGLGRSFGMEVSSKPANDWPAGSGRDWRCVMADALDLAAMRCRGPDSLEVGGLNRRGFAGLGFQAWARAGRWLALIGPGQKPLAGD